MKKPLRIPKVLKIHQLFVSEDGIVLVTSLIFLSIIALIGSTAVIVTTTDIKIGGNYKTSVQAFYSAEAGIQDGIGRLISGTISDSGSTSDTNWNTGNPYYTSGIDNDFSVTHHVINGSVVTSSGNSLYKITSTGTSGTSSKTLEAVVALTFTSAFDNALHGCDGVAISSNASTDSYSSSGAGTSGDNGSIGTSNAGANVTFDSNTIVSGDVSATGSLTLNGNAEIMKDASANNGITLNGQNKIWENASTNGNIHLEQSEIHGDAKSSGDIRLDHNSSRVFDDATAAGSISCKNGCGGKISGSESSLTDPGLSTPVVETTPCDPLNLTTLFDDADDIVGSNDNGDLSNPPLNGLSFSMSSNDTSTIGASGDDKDYHFSDFSLDSNSILTIQGDVTLYVDGNFSLNSNTEVVFAAGASLTINVTGTFNIDSNAKMNDGGRPQNLQIYSNATSSDNGDYKVELNSNSGFRGTIYAPNSAIDVNSNSNAYGAVRGKYVNMASNGAFHYDEDLQNLAVGSTAEGHTIISWREVY